MYLVTHDTRKTVIKLFINDEAYNLLKDSTLYVELRDFHGYCKDYTLYANELRFELIPDEHWLILEQYRHFIENEEDAIDDLLLAIRSKLDYEEMEKSWNT